VTYYTLSEGIANVFLLKNKSGTGLVGEKSKMLPEKAVFLCLVFPFVMQKFSCREALLFL
jgi:hypothetical protein